MCHCIVDTITLMFLPLLPWKRCSSLAVINVTCCCTCVRSHQQPAHRFFAFCVPNQKKTAITPGLMKYAFVLLHSHCSTVYTVGSCHLFVFPPTVLSELGFFFSCIVFRWIKTRSHWCSIRDSQTLRVSRLEQAVVLQIQTPSKVNL